MRKELLILLWVLILLFLGMVIQSLIHKCPLPPTMYKTTDGSWHPIEHRVCDMQMGMLEDRIAEQHRDNDELRQYLIRGLLDEGKLPPAEWLNE